MLVSVIIILILLLAFRYGYKRGLIKTLLSILGYVIVLLLSLYFSGPLGGFLTKYMPALDKTDGNQLVNSSDSLTIIFYRVLAFWILAIILGIILRFITQTFSSVTNLPVLSQINSLTGGLVWFLAAYILVFLGLLLLATSPTKNIQGSLVRSPVAEYIMKETPVFSRQVLDHWSDSSFIVMHTLEVN